jgi:hypothetical protein
VFEGLLREEAGAPTATEDVTEGHDHTPAPPEGDDEKHRNKIV